jgi:hypothetical protein
MAMEVRLGHVYQLICIHILSENEPVPELVAQLSQEIYQNDLLQMLVQNIARLEFEV